MLKKIRLALYDKSDYMKNFMQYLYRQKYHALETRLFTSFENLLCQAKKGEIDVLLGGEEAEEEFTVLAQSDPRRSFFCQKVIWYERILHFARFLNTSLCLTLCGKYWLS